MVIGRVHWRWLPRKVNTLALNYISAANSQAQNKALYFDVIFYHWGNKM